MEEDQDGIKVNDVIIKCPVIEDNDLLLVVHDGKLLLSEEDCPVVAIPHLLEIVDHCRISAGAWHGQLTAYWGKVG